MKQVDGIICTSDLKNLSKALEEKGFIVHEIVYDGIWAENCRISKGVVYVYNQVDKIKIKIVIEDDLVDTLMDTLSSFGNCSLDISPEIRICLAK